MTIVAEVVFTTLAAALTLAPEHVETNRPVPKLRTAAAFRRILTQTVDGNWKAVLVRGVLNDLAKGAKIAILLDRRIDPTKKITIQFEKTELQIALQKIAAAAAGRVTLVGNVVYIGPARVLPVLESTLKKRMSETVAITRRLSRTRRSMLTRVRTVHWNDLDTPREVVDKLTKSCRMTVSGLDKIPHDLWAGCTLPDATLTEALTLILVQFDLTIRWKPKAAGIEIVPMPKPVPPK